MPQAWRKGLCVQDAFINVLFIDVEIREVPLPFPVTPAAASYASWRRAFVAHVTTALRPFRAKDGSKQEVCTGTIHWGTVTHWTQTSGISTKDRRTEEVCPTYVRPFQRLTRSLLAVLSWLAAVLFATLSLRILSPPYSLRSPVIHLELYWNDQASFRETVASGCIGLFPCRM